MTADRAFVPAKHHRPAGFYVGKVLVYVILALFAVVFLVPFLFALVTSFTTPIGIYAETFQWIPKPITVENYVELFNRVNILRGFLNTVLYIVPPVFIGVLTSAMGAYALGRLRFPGCNVVFFVFLSTMVIPGIITMIPSYTLYAKVYHWTNTPLPIIVPGCFGSAMTMFFIRQYFLTLPRELEEAALIDGMTRWGIFWKIVLPLSRAVIITQLILSLNGAYNDYLTPLLYVGTVPKLHTLQLMLSNLQTQFSTPYTLMMAGAMAALVPTFVMFLFAQKYFTEGIVMTGLKS